jgi:tetratricopeptide (TPR) repeat protein
MKDLYLLENSPKAQNMRVQVEELILSNEEANIELALQLMKGGGIPQNFYPYLWIIAFKHYDLEDIGKEAKKMLNEILSPPQKKLFLQLLKKFEDEEYYDLQEDFVMNCLNEIQKEDSTKNELITFSKAFLLMTKLGGKFLLKTNILPASFVLKHLIIHNAISFEGFNLTQIPEEIGNFTEIEFVDLIANPLEDIPDSFQKLKNLHSISFSEDKMSVKAIQKLCNFFPKIMSKHYESRAWNRVNMEKLDEALTFMKKANQLDKENADIWDGLSWIYAHKREYESAFECSNQAVLFAKTNHKKGNFLANMASAYQRHNNKEKAKEIAHQSIEVINQIPLNEWNDDIYFAFGLASQIAEKFEQALQAYNNAEQVNPYYGDGIIHYNRACVYALLKNKEKMLFYLQEACNHSNQKWYHEALHDVDFEFFWNDKDLSKFASTETA